MMHQPQAFKLGEDAYRRGDFGLQRVNGRWWIGVYFGRELRLARMAWMADLKWFGALKTRR